MSDQPALFYTFFHFPTSPAVSPCLPTAPLPYFLRRWLAFGPIFCFQPPTFAPTTQKKDRQLAVNEPRPISETLSNIGYGLHSRNYADGKTRAFYQIGISANTTGISVYILGIEDKKYLAETYGKELGKASVTGYCIKFKRLIDVNSAILQAAIRDGIAQTSS